MLPCFCWKLGIVCTQLTYLKREAYMDLGKKIRVLEVEIEPKQPAAPIPVEPKPQQQPEPVAP